MKRRIEYGIPAAVGLGAAGLAAAEGNDPLSILGAGVGGFAGGVGAMRLAVPELAGKYAVGGLNTVQDYVTTKATNARMKAAKTTLDGVPIQRSAGQQKRADLLARGMGDIENIAKGISDQAAQNALTTGLVGVGASTAALGGMAAGRAIGAVGQMMGIDPEAPGSSNTQNSRLSMQSNMYPLV